MTLIRAAWYFAWAEEVDSFLEDTKKGGFSSLGGRIFLVLNARDIEQNVNN